MVQSTNIAKLNDIANVLWAFLPFGLHFALGGFEKLKIKVYTGKKYKIYKLKTNKKGVAKLNTKKLKRGSHKVVITSGNSNYKVSAKSTIKIK